MGGGRKELLPEEAELNRFRETLAAVGRQEAM
jgi:hypothetical protein